MTDEAFQNLCKLARELVAATAATVAAEGAENFIEYCEKAKEQFSEAGMRSPRGQLMIALDLKIGEVKAGKISGNILAIDNPKREKARAAVKREGKPRDTPRRPNPDPYGMAAALPIPGHLPNDPDDAEW